MSIGNYDKCIVIEAEFIMATVADIDTRCNGAKYVFRDFRDVDRVEDVEKYVKKLLGCKTIRDLTVTFSTEAEDYATMENYCRIIRRWENEYRIIKWQGRNIIGDYTQEKVTTKDIRALYLATVEKLFDRFPDADATAV